MRSVSRVPSSSSSPCFAGIIRTSTCQYQFQDSGPVLIVRNVRSSDYQFTFGVHSAYIIGKIARKEAVACRTFLDRQAHTAYTHTHIWSLVLYYVRHNVNWLLAPGRPKWTIQARRVSPTCPSLHVKMIWRQHLAKYQHYQKQCKKDRI